MHPQCLENRHLHPAVEERVFKAIHRPLPNPLLPQNRHIHHPRQRFPHRSGAFSNGVEDTERQEINPGLGDDRNQGTLLDGRQSNPDTGIEWVLLTNKDRQ